MCGLVGSFSLDRTVVSTSRLRQAMDLVAHRGPDSSGTSVLQAGRGQVSMGFHRLSIIDLSDLANQPFVSDSGRFSLVFNGEIYNYLELKEQLQHAGHVFKTKSDTEVLLASWSEWGLSSLSKFVGMFSFVLTDNLKSEMYCVRDAFGIKPLFYSHNKESFFFASEIPALRLISGSGTIRNEKVAQSYLLSGRYDFGNETFFDGIYNLPPGHLIVVSLDKSSIQFRTERWWKPEIQSTKSLSLDQATEELRNEFLTSIRMHLRSDVKIALSLSGGIDSSAIAAAIRYLEPAMEINTFSFVGGSGSENEEIWIDRANSQVQAKRHLIKIDDSEFVRDSDELIILQGEPFGSTSIYAQFRVFQEAKIHGIKVVLDGQGADELFAGYHGYPENFLMSKLESFDIFGAMSFMYHWGSFPNRSRLQLFSSLAKTIATTARPFGLNLKPTFSILPDFFHGNFLSEPSSLNYLQDFDWSKNRLTQRLLFEQNVGALPSLLRHVDRNSMYWSIESRVPFLTPGLATLGLGVPENFLLSDSGITKYLLRLALKDLLNVELINRRDKVGFATPQRNWLRHLIKSKPEVLDGLVDFEYLDPVKTRKFLLGQRHEEYNHTAFFWRTYNLIRWNQLFFNR